MKLSVIVPIYNTERYLSRCIESLLCIDVSDYEIILVDDGSTDSSGEICDEYAEKYSAVRSFHKKNGGIISARVFGVENSCGKYIAFVDSDDWVGKSIFTEFLSEMESDTRLDACIGGLMKVFPDGTRHPVCRSFPSELMTNIEAMMEMLMWEKFRWELCGNVYRRALFQNFHPPEEICVGEDFISNFYLLREARKVLYQPIYQYFYYFNSESTTESNKTNLKSVMKVYYYVSRLGLQDKKLQNMIEIFYAKVMIRDIFYRILYDEFTEYCSFCRGELKRLISNPDVYSFYAYYFNMMDFQNCLEKEEGFHNFWIALFEGIVNKLRSCTIPYQYVYIYGTGVISRFIRGVMDKYDIRYDLCVISDGQGRKNTEERYISEIDDENANTFFILALASTYHEDVIKILNKKGYTHILAIDIICDNMYR